MPWKISGSYFESCSCDVVCPCTASLSLGATRDRCKVVLVFTTAVSPVGLDRVAADCRALGAEKVEAWGCSTAFEERQTDWIDALRIIDKRRASNNAL